LAIGVQVVIMVLPVLAVTPATAGGTVAVPLQVRLSVVVCVNETQVPAVVAANVRSGSATMTIRKYSAAVAMIPTLMTRARRSEER
jgi:hypothetical protein